MLCGLANGIECLTDPMGRAVYAPPLALAGPTPCKAADTVLSRFPASKTSHVTCQVACEHLLEHMHVSNS
jgi:hypothetical protein